MPKYPGQLRSITVSGLEQACGSPRIVGIHCWACWNGYDYQLADRLPLITERFASFIDFYAMDTELLGSMDALARWSVLNVPAFVFLRKEAHLATLWMQQESLSEFLLRVQDWLIEAVA